MGPAFQRRGALPHGTVPAPESPKSSQSHTAGPEEVTISQGFASLSLAERCIPLAGVDSKLIR